MRKKTPEKYTMPGIDFDSVYNRNERRIIKALKQLLTAGNDDLTAKDIQDVYALALNSIPAHYVHRGTIVLRANVSMSYIQDVLKQSIEQVQKVSKP